MKYTKAMKRLEEIIGDIEREEIDVDDLASRVKEAVELIRVCKNKIEKAELEVKQVVENFEEEALQEEKSGEE
ncbi:MAG: exodeoxyribonuclease VII small subunit [Omnitrophica WOR_2 bacterium RIFCSPHIGHO2_01_FULL_48_9]|nr:MAG: exodeoxyribonuclease VII small subunit [Omnitrophica WOR_2 bacterium RIFCSPHIGHO2_02_FULL_48_11]OGX33639.1 MAG: exodeoxyribonuclease VII small subunit [Omnitrophica WOR_2 bacterium RIFCSPHIGHO2_01_FULL_48_9]